jgi:hypothetical protein
MRLLSSLLIVSIVILTGVYYTSYEIKAEEQYSIRGAFLVTRPTPKKSRPKPTPTPKINRKEKLSFQPTALGLGYTLFKKEENTGSWIRVNPSNKFRSGEKIRLFLESNSDGIVYVFHTENGINPTMIFPDFRLNEGGNAIKAHVPFSIPPITNKDNEWWYTFDPKPATERLYIVLTRNALPYIPSGSGLVDHCMKTKNCPWKVPPEIWSQITAHAKTITGTKANKDTGQKEVEEESLALTRGLVLTQDLPEPTVIRMNENEKSEVLLTVVDLQHK